MNPLEGDVNPREVAMSLRNPSRLASLLTEDVPGIEASSAEVLADIINVHRADVRRLGQVHDVDIDVDLMTEQRAADLVAGIVDGNGMELVEVFNELAEKRNQILVAALDDEEHSQFMSQKVAMMNTADPVTWDDETDDDAAEA